MAGYFRLYQIILLLVKNYRLQFRSKILMIVEFLFPILAILCLALVRWAVPQFQTQEHCFVTFESDQLIIPNTGTYKVYYTPNVSEAHEIATLIESHLEGSQLIPADTVKEIEDRIEQDSDPRLVGCFLNGSAIVFDDLEGPDVSYTIRLRHETPTRDVGRFKWYTWTTSPRLYPSGPRVFDNSYLNEGFLHLQHIVGQSMIVWLSNTSWSQFPSIEMRQLPHHPFIDDQFLINITFMLPFVLMTAYFLSVGLFTKELVLEKESRMRETMRMLGLSNPILWITWFMKQFFYLLIPTLLIAVIMKYCSIFPHSNAGALAILMVAYLLSLLSFCFLISVWFDNSKLGMMAGFVYWFLSYFPHVILGIYFDELHIGIKIVCSLLCNVSMGFATNIITMLELRGDGFQFSDFVNPVSRDDNFNMYTVVGILLLDCMLYLIIAWYISEWKPGKYGVPKKFYFPFLPSYWTNRSLTCCTRRNVVCPSRISVSASHENVLVEDTDASDSAHEIPSPEPNVSIEIKGLVKKFKGQKTFAVNQLFLKVYKGQITVVLGHNGAGKTTTMSILTGLFPPTSGTAYINGLSVVEDIDSIRRNLGICPQHNVLFDRLTVREHLYFFAKLKGVDNIQSSVDEIITSLKLFTFCDVKASELSGGYKRKLSVGIALVGNPDVLILDEPTSGMDFVSRKHVLELLKKRTSENKTIIITTHNMDDAECADRIAILSEGRLSCSGTPSFLKKRFGVGYNLRVELRQQENKSLIIGIVNKYIKDCEKYELGTEIRFLLPYEQIKNFSKLFSKLEEQQNKDVISGFSIQENKMEHVFIKSREAHPMNWEAQVRSMSRIMSVSSSPTQHPSTIPMSVSFTSVDFNYLNNGAFQGVSSPPPMTTIDEKSEASEEKSVKGLEEKSSDDDSDDDVFYSQPDDGRPALDSSMISTNNTTTTNMSFDSSTDGLNSSRRTSKHHQSTPIRKSILLPIVAEESSEDDSSIGLEAFEKSHRLSIESNDFQFPLKGSKLKHDSSSSSIPKHKQRHSFSSSLHRPSILEGAGVVISGDGRPPASQSSSDTDSAASPCVTCTCTSCKAYIPEKVKKWLQQYCAMLIKRYINFKRFKVGLFCQIILPMLFVIVGLVTIAVVALPTDSDPPRSMDIRNSAPNTLNITIFLGQFGGKEFPFTPQDFNSSLFGNPNIVNYTNDVLQIKATTLNTSINHISQCCGYEYQLLDKYCASRNKLDLVRVCEGNNNFGYTNCLERCLSCCQSKEYQLPSCSNPRHQQRDELSLIAEATDFCPTPPKLSPLDYYNPTGPLDDTGVFINEYLIKVAMIKENKFFNNVMGGFTIDAFLPPHSICGCERSEDDACSLRIEQASILADLAQQESCSKIPFSNINCGEQLEILPALGLETIYDRIGLLTATLGSDSQIEYLNNETKNFTCDDYTRFLDTNLTCVSLVDSGDLSACFDVSCFLNQSCDFNGQSPSAQYTPSSGDHTVITIWYNNQPYHVSPAMLNVLHNLLLRKIPSTKDYSITAHNYPLPRNTYSTIMSAQVSIGSFAIGFTTMIGFCFLLASFSLFIVQEKSTKAKHLQITSGLHLTAYWLANLTFDLLTSLITVVLTVIAILIAGQIEVEQYSQVEEMFGIIFLLLFVCWAQIPYIYLFSLAFNNIYIAFTALYVIFFATAFAGSSIVYILNIISNATMTATILHYLFLVNPSYGLTIGMSDMYVNYITRAACTRSELTLYICNTQDIQYIANPFAIGKPGIGAVLIYMAIEGFVMFVLTLLVDHWNQLWQLIQRRQSRMTYQKLHEESVRLQSRVADRRERRHSVVFGSDPLPRSATGLARSPTTLSGPLSQVWSTRSQGRPSISEDQTVLQERLEVNRLLKTNAAHPECTLIVGKLSKHYKNSIISRIKRAWRLQDHRPAAVSNVNVVVKERECFGLLGYNGAGKTTIFKILTGDISASCGTAIVAGHDIRTSLRQVQQNIGYCPQFDALLDRLTARETLTMFARLRGVPEHNIADEVNQRISDINLDEHADKECWKYSGGNRRKLSTAIALMGEPQVILLDEPTTGMDIETRRAFLENLKRIVHKERRSIILTSHSMNECETLCNRIGIMIKGEFRCVGSTEDLTRIYGEQETKLTITVECETEEDTIFSNMETEFNAENDPQQIELELTPPAQFLQVPAIHQDMPVLSSQLANPSSTSLISTTYTQATTANKPSSRGITAFHRMKSVRHEVMSDIRPVTSTVAITEEETVDQGEEQDHCKNIYLDKVCDAVRFHFRRWKGVRKISIENNVATFTLPKVEAPLSEIFRIMEIIKRDRQLHIVNYSVSQSNLEQVFGHFIREQKDLEEETS